MRQKNKSIHVNCGRAQYDLEQSRVPIHKQRFVAKCVALPEPVLEGAKSAEVLHRIQGVRGCLEHLAPDIDPEYSRDNAKVFVIVLFPGPLR